MRYTVIRTCEIARENDRVKKDGAKNPHKVIDKLALYKGKNTRALATVHLAEALIASGNETHTDDHSYQWMDENGWTLRTVYLQDRNGNIYQATLNIANGRDRRIIYDISNIKKIDRSATGGQVPSTRKGGAGTTSRNASPETIPQNQKKGKSESISDRNALARIADQYGPISPDNKKRGNEHAHRSRLRK